MAGPTPGGDGLQQLFDDLDDLNRRLKVLERATGTSAGSLVAQVQAAIANLEAAVTAFLSGGFTTGNIIAGNLTLGSYLFTPSGYAFDITYTRHAAYLGNDGRLGWASSSITSKELLDSISEPDALQILQITSHHYHRLAELAKRDDPASEGYVGPDYHVAVEWGSVAEELHALGLWQVVMYEWDTVWDLRDIVTEAGEPILDDEGLHLKERIPGSERRLEGSEPRPIGIHYELLGLLAIVALRHVWSEHQLLAERVARLDGQGL